MEEYDAIVIGAGHAGCEAGLALARMGKKTLLLTLSLDAVAFLACNPSIGGTAKGQLVCEVDALGGEMAVNTDKTLLQIRMLNRGKGPAVQSLRAQTDKVAYHTEMKRTIEKTENLFLKQGEVVDINFDADLKIVTTAVGLKYKAKAIVFATGVYLKSRIIIGQYTKQVGPNGFMNSMQLSDCLKRLGIELFRFKTGTPPRVHRRSINVDKLEIQEGDKDIQSFSYLTEECPKKSAVCYLTYTNPITHKIINDNIEKAPAISGEIKGIGPRYCPSIETKIIRFADKERHQLFLEPEAESTEEVYIQGFSTSMPADIQERMVHSISGLENAEIMRDSYAIEYDCINAQELKLSLEHKKLKGVFFAGQINGTSGYEEAAAQGIIAGINASLYIDQKEPLILSRSDAYIGVLIDDIVTKGTNEPYRMMTSRAEYRLLLRTDNADLRLTEIGRKVGLVNDERYEKFIKNKNLLSKAIKLCETLLKIDERLIQLFESNKEIVPKESIKVKDALKRANIDIFKINEIYHIFDEFNQTILNRVNIEIKYEGYIKQQQEDIEKAKRDEKVKIPENFNYNIDGIRLEARQKLNKFRPENLGQASRISGVSPSDVAVLSVMVKKFKKESNE